MLLLFYARLWVVFTLGAVPKLFFDGWSGRGLHIIEIPPPPSFPELLFSEQPKIHFVELRCYEIFLLVQFYYRVF